MLFSQSHDLVPFTHSSFIGFGFFLECWEISELCSELDISANAVRTRIGYWMSQGVIIEKSPDVFQAATSYSSVVKGTDP